MNRFTQKEQQQDCACDFCRKWLILSVAEIAYPLNSEVLLLTRTNSNATATTSITTVDSYCDSGFELEALNKAILESKVAWEIENDVVPKLSETVALRISSDVITLYYTEKPRELLMPQTFGISMVPTRTYHLVKHILADIVESHWKQLSNARKHKVKGQRELNQFRLSVW